MVIESPLGDIDLCVHNSNCSVRSLWSGLQRIVDQYLSQMTLGGLVCDEETMNRQLEASPLMEVGADQGPRPRG